ncbi:hypothetical protein K1719_021348 [Acacia pycnantha]|nr:hypothetical protein K1719_021348 [Acacia pycnantha]
MLLRSPATIRFQEDGEGKQSIKAYKVQQSWTSKTPGSNIEVENLATEERQLDRQSKYGFSIKILGLYYLTHFSFAPISHLPCFLKETLIAIKAPHGTTLEVPDPDEYVDYHQRTYRIILRSTIGPIDVYLVSSTVTMVREFTMRKNYSTVIHNR